LGFHGGGGRDHVTSKTLLRWLQDRQQFAEQVEAYLARTTERVADASAARLSEELSALAKRIRDET
jgi:hypothetical protein